MKYLLVISLGLILNGCGSKQLKKYTKISSVERNIDSIEISNSIRDRSIKYYSFNNVGYITYLTKSNMLCLVDIESKEVVKTYAVPSLRYESPISAYHLTGLNSGFFMSLEEMVSKGEDSFHWHFDEPQFFDGQKNNVILNSFNSFPEILQIEEGVYSIRQYSYENPWSDSNFYTVPVEAKIDLNNKVISAFNCTYPSMHKRNYFAGMYYVHRCLGHDNKIVFSFFSHPYLFVEDIETGEIDMYNCKSSSHKKNIQSFKYSDTLDMNITVQHLIDNPSYTKIFFDQKKGLYYRLFWTAGNKADGKVAQLSDKELVITVINSDYEIIKEVNIGKNYGWNFSFLTQNGLYIRKFTNSKTHIVYEIFSFS